MSGILGLLFLALPFIYWGVIPLAAVALVAWLWRRAHSKGARGAVVLLAVIGGMWLAWVLGEGEKRLTDARVRELCAIDGGVRVYETVKLPAERFDKWGAVRIPSKQDAKPSDEYYYERNTTYIKSGNPELWRTNHRIFRTRDGKLLGESTRYTRRGGDIPGPWHASSYGCPDTSVQPSLENSIFLKGDR